jgi:ribose 5-phosphate isomerase B
MNNSPDKKLKIGIACDHAGFELKEYLVKKLHETGYEVTDFGNSKLIPDDDFPDYVIPLAQSISSGEIVRGIAVCGSGVGACIAANKVAGVRACLIHEKFSARQGVEDDDMNLICFGGRVIDTALAWELTTIFLAATYIDLERHNRRLAKVAQLENIQQIKH